MVLVEYNSFLTDESVALGSKFFTFVVPCEGTRARKDRQILINIVVLVGRGY